MTKQKGNEPGFEKRFPAFSALAVGVVEAGGVCRGPGSALSGHHSGDSSVPPWPLVNPLRSVSGTRQQLQCAVLIRTSVNRAGL